MGWWKVQGTNDLVGDDPFSLLRNAAIAVAEAYYEQCERPPTRSEWERLIRDAVQPIRDLESTSTHRRCAGRAERRAHRGGDQRIATPQLR